VRTGVYGFGQHIIRNNSNLKLGGASGVLFSRSTNVADGFRLARRAVGAVSLTVTIENNGGHAISCSASALITGDLSSISDVDCANVEAGARTETDKVSLTPVTLDIPRSKELLRRAKTARPD